MVICCLLAGRVMLFPKTEDVQETFHGPGQKETVAELDQELLECTQWNSSGFLKCLVYRNSHRPDSWACDSPSTAQA